MNVATIPKDKAVTALRSQARKRLEDGIPETARSLVAGADSVERAPGDNLWDIYSKANDQRKPWSKLGGLIIPRGKDDEEWFDATYKTAALAGGLSVGIGVAAYLTGRSFWGSVGLAAIPAGGALVTAFGGYLAYSKTDIARPTTLAAAGIAGGLTASLATGNPWLGVGIGAATLGVGGVLSLTARALEGRSRDAMESIEQYSELLKDPKVLAGSKTPPTLTREQLSSVLKGLRADQMSDGDFAAALTFEELIRGIDKLSGDNLDQIYASAVKKPEVARLFEEKAPEIFKSAENYVTVTDLQDGAKSDLEVKVEDEYVEVGDILLKRDQS